jgi:hypothetical protein
MSRKRARRNATMDELNLLTAGLYDFSDINFGRVGRLVLGTLGLLLAGYAGAGPCG